MAKKTREPGRFVTLKRGRVIFIPAGKRSRWADVRDMVLARREKKAPSLDVAAKGLGQIGDILKVAGVDTESNTMRALTSALEGVRYRGGRGGDPTKARGGIGRALKIMEGLAEKLEASGEDEGSNLWRDYMEILEGLRGAEKYGIT